MKWVLRAASPTAWCSWTRAKSSRMRRKTISSASRAVSGRNNSSRKSCTIERLAREAMTVSVQTRHSTQTIRIRPGRLKDLDALIAFEAATFSVDLLSRRSFRHFLTSPQIWLAVAEREGRFVGYALVLFRPNSAKARLYSIGVAANAA